MADQPLTQFHKSFEKPLAVATATYALNILLYMQRCPALEMEGVGVKTISFLQNVRHVSEKYIQPYYENLTGIIKSLIRYASLEESCQKSGAYSKDRLLALKTVKDNIARFEHPDDEDVLIYLQNMITMNRTT